MAENIYKELSEGGGFNLPYLLHIFAPDRSIELYVINDNEDLTYNGHTYKSSNFKYAPRNDSDTNLEIAIPEDSETNAIIDLLEECYYFHIEAIGIFYDGEVTEINQFRHLYGIGTWTGKSLQMKLNKDDRLDMTFPALVFNSYNNRGNS